MDRHAPLGLAMTQFRNLLFLAIALPPYAATRQSPIESLTLAHPKSTMTHRTEVICRTADIRAIEARASSNLMERAGRAAADLALRLVGEDAAPVLIVCGPGNNGGDGLTMARQLVCAGKKVCVVFDADPAQLPADAAAAWQAFIAAGGKTVNEIPDARWSLAVDAIFGIGLTRAISGRYESWVAAFNQLPCPRLALDIPSGLDADTGATMGPVVCATHTITFIAIKPGLLTHDGPDCCGQIELAPLGMEPDTETGGWVNDPSQFSRFLTPRLKNSHKGRFGNVGIVGGAAGMAGAALLAARAALKLGAGRVFVGCLDETLPPLDVMQPELMLRAAGDVPGLADALAIGPGLGQSPRALELLRETMLREVPLVLDADALNLVAGHPVLQRQLSRRSAPSVLTPHPLEAARLLGCEAGHIQADRIGSALRLAKTFNAIVVLKGCGSVIAQGPRWWINRSGNPGMASAGMGDVLTGLIVSLLVQGWEAGAATRAATFIHGQAADDCVAAGMGPIGLCASDTIIAARTVLNRLVQQWAHR